MSDHASSPVGAAAPLAGPLPDLTTGRRSWGVEAALRGASYEILPLRNAEEAVAEHVPRDVPLTVTTTEAKCLTRIVELAERLSGHRYAATPHLAARLVRGTRRT